MVGLTVAVIGLGYFSQFHLNAWQDDPRVARIVTTDLSEARRVWAQQTFDVDVFESVAAAMTAADADIVDIVAPPHAHVELIEACLRPGRIIVCQKPFCTSLTEAKAVVTQAAKVGCRIVIHENFRFQPWHRTIKAFLDADKMGDV